MFKLIRLTVLLQGAAYSFQVVSLFIFAKILGAEGQGVLSVFRVLGQYIASLMWFGLTVGIVYFIGKDKNLFLSLLKNCMKLFIIIFPLIVLLLYVLPINKIPKFNIISQNIPYLLIIVFSLSLTNLFRCLMLSLKKYLYYNLFTFGLGFIIFVGSIIMWLVPRNYDKLTFAITIYVVSNVLVFIYGFIVTFIEGYKLKSERRVTVYFLNQFKVGLRGFISEIAATLLFRIDLFIVGYFFTFKEVGIYSIALFSAEIIIKIPYWSSAILSPMVAGGEDNHVKRTVYLFFSSVIMASLFGLLFVIIFFTFPDFISNLIGKEYKGVEFCLLLLIPRVVMQSGAAVLAANLAGKGYPWYHAVSFGVPIIFLILFDSILVPRLGIYGAALGSSLAFISTIIILMVGFKKYNTLKTITFKEYAKTVVRSLNFMKSRGSS